MNTSIAPCHQETSEKPTTLNYSPFTFYITLPTLQEKTSHQIARTIWYSYISSHWRADRVGVFNKENLITAFGIGDTFREECYRMIESLKMPGILREYIESAIKSIFIETSRWIQISLEHTFSRAWEEHWIKHFDVKWCVWLSNGKIDYAKTASKMISAPGLSLEQKFTIMSKFCMEEEIKKIPWRSLSESFITKVNFTRDSIIYYWICYLKNELDKIPLIDYNSIDAVMAARCNDRHWTAFEYFWNRLGDDDQVSVAVKKFRTYYYGYMYRWQELILSKMSWKQQNLVISKIPDIILVNFWANLHSYESAMQVWKYWKHLITPEKFCKVVKHVWTSGCMLIENSSQLLLEVWQSASDQQRNHVIQFRGSDNMIISFLCQKYHCKSGIDFFCKFLSEKSEDYRRQIMIKNAGKFGANMEDPASAYRIIQLCFPNPVDQLEFKKSIMESEYMRRKCAELFSEINLDNLMLKIKLYSTSANMTLEFMNRLLESEDAEKKEYFTEVKKWNKFSHFVDEIFSQDVTSALNFKKQFITSYAHVCSHNWNDDSLHETDKILKMVFTNDDELQLVKKNLLDSYQKLFVKSEYWNVFREDYFNNFVLWCLNGDENARDEFIKNLPVSVIFEEIFHELEHLYMDVFEWGDISENILADILASLDNLLRWYFKGVDGARMYKLRALNSIQMVFEESTLDKVLKWFFDGDEGSMLKFKKEKFQVWEK